MVNLVGDPNKGWDIFYEEDDKLEAALDKELKNMGVFLGGGFRIDE
jgi:hypothetical protein